MGERYPMTGAYAPTATCKHGDHPYDCRQGCDPHEHARYDHLHARIRELEAALRDVMQGKQLDWRIAESIAPKEPPT